MTLLDVIGIIFGALLVWGLLILGFLMIVHRLTRAQRGLHQLQARGWERDDIEKLKNDNDI